METKINIYRNYEIAVLLIISQYIVLITSLCVIYLELAEVM